MMIRLSQRDPLWAGVRIGNTNLTIGRWGCTITCISMLSDYFGCYQSPLEIAGRTGAFTKDGLFVWRAIDTIFRNMDFEWRQYGRSDARIRASLADPTEAAILEVNDKSHWIVPIRWVPVIRDYLCVDPWTGGLCFALRRYRNITGSAHVRAKAASWTS